MNVNSIEGTPKSAAAISLGTICPQHLHSITELDKITLKVFEQLTMADFISCSLVSKESYNKYTRLRKFTEPKLEKFVELVNLSTIEKRLDENFKEGSFCFEAQKVARMIYECKERGIATPKYGMAFPMSPELLSYAMYLAKDKNVLEIAGASGENAALLAFSGAKRVYMNDIDPAEMKKFCGLRSRLPRAVSKKLDAIEGSCFEILEKKLELASNVDVILCQNLIHFFNHAEQVRFFSLLKQLLKRGGRAIFTANATYAYSEDRAIFSKHPENNSWRVIQCLISDYSQSTMPLACIYREISPCSPDQISCDYVNKYLLQRDSKTNFVWKKNNKEYDTLESELKLNLKNAVDLNAHIINRIFSGSVRLLSTTVNIYSEESLSALFKGAGFEVERTFSLTRNGHLFHGGERYNQVSKVGVIVKNRIH